VAELGQNPHITPESIRERIEGTFPGDMGIEPLEVSEERARGSIVVDRRHLHPGGFVHGGVWVALADSVAAWGTFRNLPVDYDFTTVELKLNVFAAAAEGDELIATAEPRHVGRRTHVWYVEIHRGERQMAMFSLTQFVIAPNSA
jgi:1,4-dihydroxy-2-naphthoyl-CoA hydrolase